MRLALLLVTGLLLVPSIGEAKDDVTMYGASWCGPCRTVRTVLDRNAIPYKYVDIDSQEGAAAYKQARGSSRGIPLLVIGSKRIVGANFPEIQSALSKGGVLKGLPAATDKGQYGGQTAAWWQSQFRSMRNLEQMLDKEVTHLERVAADDVEKTRLERIRDKHEIVRASLVQLENDASRAAVPRKFRR